MEVRFYRIEKHKKSCRSAVKLDLTRNSNVSDIKRQRRARTGKRSTRSIAKALLNPRGSVARSSPAPPRPPPAATPFDCLPRRCHLMCRDHSRSA
ncbi:hypothetical protein EVAR_39104_1 [Eumeta japonica]|uniref:Uncharacterized protein n=1 Tax=Eumeta variegata TaxID=151549 RepID=A0A4C1X835_EUMVA|nr:hypothetical protein EVAR_39104_1 [Eumeta japonica]